MTPQHGDVRDDELLVRAALLRAFATPVDAAARARGEAAVRAAAAALAAPAALRADDAVAATAGASPSNVVSLSDRFLRRPRAVAAAVATCTILSSSGVAAASTYALPGDPLYPVKRVVEQVVVAAEARGDEARAQVRFAARRLEEAERLAARGDAGASAAALERFARHATEARRAGGEGVAPDLAVLHERARALAAPAPAPTPAPAPAPRTPPARHAPPVGASEDPSSPHDQRQPVSPPDAAEPSDDRGSGTAIPGPGTRQDERPDPAARPDDRGAPAQPTAPSRAHGHADENGARPERGAPGSSGPPAPRSDGHALPAPPGANMDRGTYPAETREDEPAAGKRTHPDAGTEAPRVEESPGAVREERPAQAARPGTNDGAPVRTHEAAGRAERADGSEKGG